VLDISKKSNKNTGKKNAAKPNPASLKNNATSNQIVGLDGNQLLEAINKDSADMPMKMRVSSALHDKAQEQVNQCSQRLCTKATLKLSVQPDSQTAHMEGIEGVHSQAPS